MKRVSITLPDELYEHLAKMENKSEYVRDLIRRDLNDNKKKPSRDSSSPQDVEDAGQGDVDIEQLIHEHEQRMAKALMLADALNKRTMSELAAVSKRLNELEMQLKAQTGYHTTHENIAAYSSPTPPLSTTAEGWQEPPENSESNTEMAEKKLVEMSQRDEVLACIPKSTPVKRSALESMLAKRFGESVHTLIDDLIASKLVSVKVEDGVEMVWR